MKISKIREMSSPELEKELGELKSELFKLKFSLATHGLDNPMNLLFHSYCFHHVLLIYMFF